MIVGIGLDIVEVSRFGSEAHPRLEERILTPGERVRVPVSERRRREYVAGRFAVKEATAKAAGCGIGKTVGWQDIEVLTDRAGRPAVTISPEVLALLGWEDVSIHCSITHSQRLVAAQVIVER
ncbi:MAG: holo-ACP synthase [Novibacillus thermophilus]